jgi:hypothetical protein
MPLGISGGPVPIVEQLERSRVKVRNRRLEGAMAPNKIAQSFAPSYFYSGAVAKRAINH